LIDFICFLTLFADYLRVFTLFSSKKVRKSIFGTVIVFFNMYVFFFLIIFFNSLKFIIYESRI
jgi:hypothetical protein